MKQRLLITLRFVLFSAGLFAQEETLFNNDFLKWSGVWSAPIYSVVVMNNQPLELSGYHVGVELNKDWLLGFMWQENSERTLFDGLRKKQFEVETQALYLGYRPWSYRVLHPVLSVSAHRMLLEDKRGSKMHDRALALQPGVGAEINVTRWLRVYLRGGYLLMFDTDLPDLTDRQMSGWSAEAGINFGWSWAGKPKKRPRQPMTPSRRDSGSL